MLGRYFTTRTGGSPERARHYSGLRLMGALPSLLRDPLGFAVSARARHGEIYEVDVGFLRFFALNHPRHVQHVLRDQVRNYTKGGPVWEHLRKFSGNGLPTSEGDFWLRQRRMIQPTFHKERLAAMIGLIDGAIDESIGAWDEAASSGEPFDVSHALERMVMGVIVKTMFGAEIAPEEFEVVSRELRHALGYLLPGVVLQSLPKGLPFPGRRRFEQALRSTDDIVFRLIARRRRRGAGPGGDFIGMMLDAVDDETGASMTDQQLRDEAVSAFIAGFETTTTMLSFTCGLLAEHPDVARAVGAECDAVLGQASPGLAQLSRLRMATMVLQETLRLFPPVYWLPRTAVADDVIDGVRVPAGAMVSVMIYVIHRHPELWDAPEHFDPWRFSPERSAGRHPLAWMPFGAGQRLCVGRDLSFLEGQLILARLLSRFELEVAPGRRSVRPALATTLRPRDGVWLRLRRRSPCAVAAPLPGEGSGASEPERRLRERPAP